MTKKSITIQTPVTLDPKGPTVSEEIPLPPEHMWAELENGATPEAPAAPAETPAASAATAARPVVKVPVREVAELEFTGAKKPWRDIPLEYPFPFGGREVTEIRVRRLTVSEVGDLLETVPDDRPDNFDIYAVMAGLPAPVLRGLIDVDGERVVGACWDFLPRSFRPAQAPADVSS
ncbi:MAG: phage tail assembly protein [Rhizobiaceae bacterium]|nr:phage tail assembly protein [Rhizobiaceae bacterium]